MSYIKRLWRALRAATSGITSFFREIVSTLFEGPLGALERVVRRLLALLATVADFIRTIWLRIWGRSPTSPKDRRPTPGRGVIPLIAATATVSVWYLFPLSEFLGLSNLRFNLALAATWITTALLARGALRQQRPSVVANWLQNTHHRTGLIWFERAAFVALAAGGYFSIGEAQTTVALWMLAFGFLTLLGSEYSDRPLTDALPRPLRQQDEPASDADQSEGEETQTVLRTFHWMTPAFENAGPNDITVTVDTDRYETMKSTNPKRPTGGRHPDWTPWVTGGWSEEVAHAATAIRLISDRHSFSRFQEAATVLGFAQSVPYSFDSESTGEQEYWRYPIETIMDATGDCEDMSILAAAVLIELGHDVLPLVTNTHAAIGIEAPPGMPGAFVEHEGRRYYYSETTYEGARIGELPDEIRLSDLYPCPLRRPETP